MDFFKQKPIIEPTKESLEKSIRNNLRNYKLLSFTFFGFLTIYSIACIRMKSIQPSLELTNIIILTAILSVFSAMYLIIHKIDKARLEIWKAKNEE